MKQVQKSTNKWNLCPFLIRTKCYRRYNASRNQRPRERTTTHSHSINSMCVFIHSQEMREAHKKKWNKAGMEWSGQSENRNVWRKPAVDHCFRLPLKTNEAKECNLSIICFRSHISLGTHRDSFQKQQQPRFNVRTIFGVLWKYALNLLLI